ncbi:MAG TPA: efflux RND transporter periplasmic adaptor subunit [Candidatus Manganitrophaceae bacterium]|nr:efflux RND transporter periplasmic adaptor subunit [Candidatus Manganitrophaceae bacterium]
MFFQGWKKWVWLAGLFIAAAGGAALFRNGEKGAEHRTAAVERGDITASVSATGKVNAVVTVQVGSQVSGTIQRLFADFNSRVKKGEVIAQIDPAILKVQVEQAKAKLANDEANTDKARVVLSDATRNLRRMEALLSRNFISQSDKDAAQTAADSAVAGLRAAETQVEQGRAALKLAETNLRYTTIVSPVDGIVISRNVDVGQTVAASLQAPTLFTIAQDLTEMQVDTSVDEADIGNVHVGQEAEFTVDAYPDSPFAGRVHDIYNQPITVQNVVTYDAIIRVKNPDLKLKPGMTANVRIKIGFKDNVLKLPNVALRYRPDKGGGPSTPVKQGGTPHLQAKAHEREVWVLREGKEVSVSVALGLSDGSFTEVISGDLKPEDQVITEKIRKNNSTQGSGRLPMRF